eukprot:TRINITY_DN37394_c0_g1_i1.p1 TRINITY_DN37394_c0_g1~~TRINITY_DN37394_c0_g1_i1.p1  ORF type:complete len:190 (-),score=34.06 TRINITY_DN37394_c0_g1_i1:156-725(-)
MDLSAMTRSDLLMWKNWKRTAVVFGCLDIVLLVYFFSSLSPLALFSNVGIFVIVLGAAAKVAGADLDKVGTVLVGSAGNLDGVAESLGAALNSAIALSVHVLLWENQADTCKALAGFYVLSLLAGFMSVSSVAFIVVNFLFIVPYTFTTVPAVIKLRETTLQPTLALVMAKKDELLGKIPDYTQVYKAS